MAVLMNGPKPNNIARCLNALALMNMRDIASADIISDLVNDYFIIRPIGNDESNSDLWKTLLPLACWLLMYISANKHL